MTRALRFVVIGLTVFVLTAIGLVKSGWMVEWNGLEGDSATLGLPPMKMLEKVVCDGGRDFRLLFVGDVHGQYDELMHLIENEAGGLDEQTTVVLLGDMVSKGPDSKKVVSYILQHRDRVRIVFGNHDLAMLFAFVNPELNFKPLEKIRGGLLPLRFDNSHELFVPEDLSKVKMAHSVLARELGLDMLTNYALHGSVALEFELPTGDTLYAVHAGMLPGDFVDRVPSVRSITEMKYVELADWTHTSKTKFPGSERWYKLWNHAKHKKHTTVLYGHDAKKGLNLRDHTKGLDSGCVKGKKLSGFEYKYHHKTHKITTRLLQTNCVDHRP